MIGFVWWILIACTVVPVNSLTSYADTITEPVSYAMEYGRKSESEVRKLLIYLP